MVYCVSVCALVVAIVVILFCFIHTHYSVVILISNGCTLYNASDVRTLFYRLIVSHTHIFIHYTALSSIVLSLYVSRKFLTLLDSPSRIAKFIP